MPRLTRAAIAALAAATALALWAVAHGMSGLLYAAAWTVIVAPGLPLGFALFGRPHAAGWIAGALIGYAVAVLAFWAAIETRAATPTGFIVALAAAGAVAAAAARAFSAPLVILPPWNGRAAASIAGVLLVTLALAAPPLANVGARDAAGNIRYRAYFSADFVWHEALTAELTRFALPPRNPYLAPQPMHYYWGYFLVPAVLARTGPAPIRDVERCLVLNALLTGMLLMSAVFMTAYAVARTAAAAAAATIVALCGSSLEGIYEVLRLRARGLPLSSIRDVNVDALTAWYFSGHRIDGLPRCLWYVPQHSMAYALGLVALTGAAAAGSNGPPAAVLIQGLALAGATMLNPFVGGVFALVWGLSNVIHAVTCGRPARRILLHATAAVPVLLAAAWCAGNGMVEGAGSALEIAIDGASRHAPVLSLVLSLGPVLLAAAAGLVVALRRRATPALPVILLCVVSLVLMYGVRLNVDHEWVPFRAGQMLLAAAPALAALWFGSFIRSRWRTPAAAAATVLFLAGLPTTAIDAYNAQDIGNLHAGPGFRWTLILTPAQQRAFDWIRRETPRQAIVQMEPIVRERDSWSLIPSFAHRHMAAGLPISLLRTDEYRDRSEQVRTIYASSDAGQAAAIAHKLHIRYLYVDATDRAAYPRVAKFDESPQYFTPVFRMDEVGVYQVR